MRDEERNDVVGATQAVTPSGLDVAGDRAKDAWLERFHAGDRALLEACYHDHFETVSRAVRHVTSGADRETVIHDVFVRLLSDAKMRAKFGGGSLGAWLSRVAYNLAIDQARRRQRERPIEPAEAARLAGGHDAAIEERTEARRLVEKFQKEQLPAGWEAVFVARFVEQRSQRDAARTLGLARTTLAFREKRIRKLLERFLLGESK